MSSSNHSLPPAVEMSDLQLLTYLLALAGDGEEAARATAHTL